MYNPIFSRKRFGFCALILCAFSFSSTFNPHLLTLSFIADPLNFKLSINDGEDVLLVDDMSRNSKPTHKIFPFVRAKNEGELEFGRYAENFKSSNSDDEKSVVKETSAISGAIAIERKKLEPICTSSNYCEIEGDIRVEANSSTIFVVKTLQTISDHSTNCWTTEPYPRKGTRRVKNWTVRLYDDNHDHDKNRVPKCSKFHNNPAILFSVGGFTGNYFHDFADLLFPLYSTSFHFQKEVHFLASDYQHWWTSKFRHILNKLTKNQILDIDGEKSQVHCYKKMTIGLKFHKELILHPNSPTGLSMQSFRHLIRQAYSLDRERAIMSRKRDTTKTRPRLMIISRKRSRIITNEHNVSRLARKLGYEVVLAEAGVSTNMSRFARTVNSFDVLMGVHGAGLTNMVFLPDKAVLIQVVPFGAIDGFARLDFGNPAAGMDLRYLEYKIAVKESSLSRRYPNDHPILKDPNSYKRKRWSEISSVYLDTQNVTIDLHRIKGTLTKALGLLRN